MDNNHIQTAGSVLGTEQFLRAILETTADGFWVLDVRSQLIIEVNHAYCRMSGYTRDELMRLRISDLDAVESPIQTTNRTQQIIQHGTEMFETRHRRKDGSVFDVELSVSYLENDGGRFICFCRDITEKKQAKELLRQSEEFSRAIIASSPLPIVSIDLDGNVLSWNPAAEKLFGWCEQEVLGKAMPVIGDRQEEFRSLRKRLLDTGGFSGIELVRRKKTGDPVDVRLSAAPIRGDQGSIIGIIASFEDVTLRKQTEEKLRESEEKHRTLFSTMTQGVVYQNAAGEIISANPAAERILGITFDQMRGLTSMDPRWKAIREDGSDFPGPLHPIPMALKTGKEIKDVVHGVFHPEKGNHVWVKVSAVPLFRPGESTPYQAYATMEDITERRKAEEKYRMLFHQMLDGFALHEMIFDAQGRPVNYRFLDVNPAFERMTGLKAGEIIGRTVTEVLPGIEQHWIERYGMVALTGEPVFFEDYFVNLNKHFQVTAFRPSPGQFACIFSDITDRKQAVEALRRSEESHRALIEGLPDITIRFDREGRHLFVSENVNEVVTLSASQFLGKTHRELGFPVELCATWEEAIRTVCNTQKPYESEFSFKGRRGHTIMNWRLIPEIDASGKVGSILSISRDITRHKLIEDRFHKFFSQISQLAYIISSDGTIIDVNDAVIQRLGYEKAELVGSPLKKIYSPESLEKMKVLFDQWKKTGMLKNEEMTIVTKAGEKRTVLLNASAIRDEYGKIIHSVSLHTDITELKKLQDEVAKGQKLESLGILAGGIAHDFNNLLGGIFGRIDMAAASTKEKVVSNHLAKALGSMERARGLTHQLLTFATGGVPIKKLNALSPFIQETVQFALSGSKISPVFLVPEDLWVCEFDRNQIGQVIDNIVINAKQAMPDGGTIDVAAANVKLGDGEHSLLVAGTYVRISVKDRGIGMPKDILPRIFDPFYTTKPKGHGLGLTTCYSIINRHGGCIDVESEPGKGSAFHIYLPAAPGTVLKTIAERADVVQGSGTILIMDDEEVMRDTIEDMLKAIGYSVICTRNGLEAIRAFSADVHGKRSITAILFDLTIPGGMGGAEAIVEIRKIDKQIPVFVASGYAEDPVMADPARYGFTSSICKPFRRADLAEMLGKHVTAGK